MGSNISSLFSASCGCGASGCPHCANPDFDYDPPTLKDNFKVPKVDAPLLSITASCYGKSDSTSKKPSEVFSKLISPEHAQKEDNVRIVFEEDNEPARPFLGGNAQFSAARGLLLDFQNLPTSLVNQIIRYLVTVEVLPMHQYLYIETSSGEVDLSHLRAFAEDFKLSVKYGSGQSPDEKPQLKLPTRWQGLKSLTLEAKTNSITISGNESSAEFDFPDLNSLSLDSASFDRPLKAPTLYNIRCSLSGLSQLGSPQKTVRALTLVKSEADENIDSVVKECPQLCEICFIGAGWVQTQCFSDYVKASNINVSHQVDGN